MGKGVLEWDPQQTQERRVTVCLLSCICSSFSWSHRPIIFFPSLLWPDWFTHLDLCASRWAMSMWSDELISVPKLLWMGTTSSCYYHLLLPPITTTTSTTTYYYQYLLLPLPLPLPTTITTITTTYYYYYLLLLRPITYCYHQLPLSTATTAYYYYLLLWLKLLHTHVLYSHSLLSLPPLSPHSDTHKHIHI